MEKYEITIPANPVAGHTLNSLERIEDTLRREGVERIGSNINGVATLCVRDTTGLGIDRIRATVMRVVPGVEEISVKVIAPTI